MHRKRAGPPSETGAKAAVHCVFAANANLMENIMSSSQTPVAQGFAGDGDAAEQPRGPAVLVAGANGLVGSAVVRRLVAQTWAGSVTALVRRQGALTAGQAMPGRLRERVVDFDRLEISLFARWARPFARPDRRQHSGVLMSTIRRNWRGARSRPGHIISCW